MGGTSPSAGATVEVLLNEPVRDQAGKPAIIHPRVHGHFAEHIGGVIYDGIWVGPDSSIPNIKGIRQSLVESLQKLSPPVIRWPGGCFADRYHWRDGIGSPASRPRRFNRWREVPESNAFGTHEFLEFCKLVNAEPYLAANVGTGTPEEFQQWVEYCNAPAGFSTLADERGAHGHADPFKVSLWGVGNESWGCGGKFTPEDYCTEYRRYTEWVPGFGVPLYLLATGPNGRDVDWTRRLMKKWSDGARAPLQAITPHYYCGTAGTSTDFTIDQWYQLLSQANEMERLINDHWSVLGEFDRDHHIKLAVDEWGCWHQDDPRLPAGHQFAQFSTMRDALVSGLTLDTFHRHADKVTMANVAQLVNCLHSLYMTDGDKLVETTNYHVFMMHRPHQGGSSLGLRVQTPPMEYAVDQAKKNIFSMNGSASVKGKTLTLTLTHTGAKEPMELAIRLNGGKGQVIEAGRLAHARLNAVNTPEHPKAVVPGRLEVKSAVAGDVHTVVLPPACVAMIQFAL